MATPPEIRRTSADPPCPGGPPGDRWGGRREALALEEVRSYSMSSAPGSTATSGSRTPPTPTGPDIPARVRAGTFGVNQGDAMDPAAPLGGVKACGHGRELGPEGLDVTSISVAPATA